MKTSKWILMAIMAFNANMAYGADQTPVTPNTVAPETMDSDLEKIKKRYWAEGDETEIGVVQNRTYTKAGKIEIGVLGGISMSDPFISVQTLGFDLGLNFSEYFAVHALVWKHFVSPSSALETFQQESQATTNTNYPEWYAGAEAVGSIFYGKLSVFVAKIIYYDLYLMGGLGMTGTQSGNDLTPHVGIGQRFYVNNWLSICTDYRLQYYRETVIEKEIITKLGQSVGERNVFANNLQLDVQFLLPVGLFK